MRRMWSRLRRYPVFNHLLSFYSLSESSESFYDGVLRSCNSLASLKQVHSSLATSGLIAENPHLSAKIILKYSKFGHLNNARYVFDNFPSDKCSSFLWNTMIRAYANGGDSLKTLELYLVMRRTGIRPNNYTFPFVLKACGSELLVFQGEVVHGDVVRTGFHSDLYVEAALVDMYAKCGQTDDGRKVFDKMLLRDLVSWTAMMTAYEQAEQPLESLMLLQRMQGEGLRADSVTVVTVASAVGQLGDATRAQSIHAYVIRNRFIEDVCVQNSVISMYSKCGNVEKARWVFDQMDRRDGISWNSMLSGYIQNGQASEAILLFEQMQESESKLNPVTALIMVSACAYLGSRYLGKKLHDFIIDSNIKIDTTLRNALMDMYAKCGDLDIAVEMFNDIYPSEQHISSWNVLISGYGMNGRGKEALEIFYQMTEQGIKPDHITFTSILSACSHAGLITEGKKCFSDMTKLSMTPEVKHYACMVDMLGRAGLLYEAFELITQMKSSPNDGVWGALLLACRIHGNTELGEIVASKLFQLEPDHTGYYVLMSNIYAASNKWQEVGKMRVNMKNKGLRKPAAFSVIEFGKEIIGFHTADQCSAYCYDVYRKVESMAIEMQMAGYVPDRSCVLHDVEDEDKDHILNYHSEKLAVAFGLLKIELGMTIQVTKNLRICNDCHSAFKSISFIYERKIIIRDANRFHHFEGGLCSCKDYW